MSTAPNAHDNASIHHPTQEKGIDNHFSPEIPAFPAENQHELASNHAKPDGATRPEPTAAQAAQLFVFSAAKAGMKDVDKERVQQVVYDMSKDSLFFQNSIKQDEKVEARIAAMRSKLQALSTARRETLRRQIGAQVAKLETMRDLTRTKVVVDMDMFYAAVEMRENPSLRDKPLAVGGIGMLSTTNYVARKFGVRAAMPGFIGKELCPELVIVPPNFPKYTAISAQIRAIVAEYDPQFRAMSLDEVYCDITDYMESNWTRYARTGTATARHNSDESDGDDADDLLDIQDQADEGSSTEDYDGARDDDESERLNQKRPRTSSVVPPGEREAIAAAIVDEIRRKIFEKTQLRASAGIAANTMLAKICSDFNKPNGQYVLPFARDDILAFVEKLPVRKIGGIGKVMEKTLNAALSITTGKDLYDRRVEICHLFSERTATWLLRISMGIQGSSRDEERSGRKSYSRERTFSARGIGDPKMLEKICQELCERLAVDMEGGGHGAKTITLKLKCVDFSVRSRAVSTTRTTRSKDDLFAYAVELLRKEMPLRLRLLGVRTSALVGLDGTNLADSTRKRQAMMDTFTTSMTSNEIHSDSSHAQLWTENNDLMGEMSHEESDDGDVGGNSNNRQLSQKKQLPIQAFATREATFMHAETGENPPQTVVNRPQRERSGLFGVTQTTSELPAPDATEFQPCPVCNKMINASNAIAIDVHVDACLRRSENNRKKQSFQQFFKS